MIWLALGTFVGLYWISRENYLLFHTLAELFSILIAGSIFVLAWNTRDFLRNGYLKVLGIGMLFVAMLDLLHTLSFENMGVYVNSNANLPTQFWLAARFLHSGTMLAAAIYLPKKQISMRGLIVVYAIITGLFLAAIYGQVFPVSLIETPDGVVLTPFKIASEYIIILIFLLGMILTWIKRSSFDPEVLSLVLFSGGFSAVAELLFTDYSHVTDLWNMGGHFFKLISFYLIYKAIVETGFVRPVNLLFHDLHQREADLRESEHRERQRAAQLEAIMDAVPAVVWIANDRDCHVVTGNRASYEFLRLPQSANQSKSALQDAPSHFKVLQNGNELAADELPLQISAASGLSLRDFEETVLFDTGESRQLYGNVSPLFDAAGNPSGAIGVFIDISERVLAEQALQESERRFRNLFETMTEGFALYEILYDENGIPVDYRLQDVNPAFERMAGLDRSEMVGRVLTDLRPDFNQEMVYRFTQVAETGQPDRFEDFSALLQKYVEVLVYSLGDHRVAALFTDITQRRFDREALEKSEARLRRLVDSNIIGIIYADGFGRITVANDAFLDLVGYTREDLEAGRVDWIQMTPPEYVYLDEKGMSEANEDGACTPYEKEYLRKDGRRVPVLIGFAYYDQADPPYICFVVDLTERKQSEARLQSYALQLERSNRELQEFAFVASHDLQEPLRKIQAFGDRLKSALNDRLEDGERDYLERMLNSATRMRNMVNDLLSLSRVTTRGHPFEPVDLNKVLQDVLSDLDVRIERCQGQVEVSPLPQVHGDPIQIHQLFLNLVGNALKFQKPQVPPVVRVSARKAEMGRAVQILVEDNGVGFEEQYTERIFQPFQRLYGMGQYEGSGIGLAICRKIVERHAGQITAHSTPGIGSNFIVTLPDTLEYMEKVSSGM